MEGSIAEAYRKSPSWPIVINLRADPYEVSWKAALYTKWYGENMWMFVPAQQLAANFIASFEKYPPVKGSSLSVDEVVKTMSSNPQN